MHSLRLAACLSFAILGGAACARAQSTSAPPASENSAHPSPVEIKLIVPPGTPLRVALKDRLRVKQQGQPLSATLTQSVYAFDTEVIPAGSLVTGRVERVDPVSKKRRALGIANADFTPAHEYTLVFDSVHLPDGRQLSLSTDVSKGAARVIHLVTDPGRQKKKNKVAQAAADAKQEVKDRVHSTLADIKAPGRVERLKRYLLAQLPVRRQYLQPGMRFNAVLRDSLDFGTVTRSGEELASLGAAPPDGSMLVAQLATEASSASAKQGAPVEAIVSTPLFNSEQKLVIPANSKLHGEVVQVKRARRLHRDGQIRVSFRSIELPDGVVRPVRASLEGMEVDQSAGLKLDAEGGAQATESKTRYLSTALSILVATAAAQGDQPDPGESAGAGDPGTNTVAGSSGFKLVGAALGYTVHSHVFSAAMGAYGAASSIYSHSLSRGREAVLARHTPLEISFGKPQPSPESHANEKNQKN